MNSWETITFEDLYLEPSRNGLTKPKRVRGTGYKMVNMGELFSDDRIGDIPMERVPMSDREMSNYFVRVGDLLFARQSLVAAGAGKCSIIIATPELTTFESHLIRIRLDRTKADPLFYFYYFSSTQGKGNIQSLVMQVAAAGIRGSELARLPVPRPPIPTQRKIAAILSAYDDLIDNNNRRINILEEMARLIYQEWFVNFRFPGHGNVNMVDSPLGRIPEGWYHQELGRMVEIQKGKKSKILPDKPSVESTTYLLIDGLKNGKYVYTSEQNIPIAKKDDIIMVMDGASSGDVYIGEYGAVGSTLAYFRSTDKERLSPYTLYFFLKEHNQDIVANNIGSAIPHANKDFIRKLQIPVPLKELNETFNRLIADYFALKENLLSKNIILRESLATLLPKLVSGDIDVSQLDITIAEEAA